jgi:hypothetical protein
MSGLVIRVIVAYGCIKMFCIIRQNAFALEDFDHRNLVFMQNKPDIRNQHQKLHLIANFFPKHFCFKVRLVVHYGLKSGKKWRRERVRSNFEAKVFWKKIGY